MHRTGNAVRWGLPPPLSVTFAFHHSTNLHCSSILASTADSSAGQSLIRFASSIHNDAAWLSLKRSRIELLDITSAIDRDDLRLRRLRGSVDRGNGSVDMIGLLPSPPTRGFGLSWWTW